MLSGLGVRCGFTVAFEPDVHVGGYWSATRAGGGWFCRIKGETPCPRHGSEPWIRFMARARGEPPLSCISGYRLHVVWAI